MFQKMIVGSKIIVAHYCRKTTDHLDQEIETEITEEEIPETTIETIETTETIETIVIVSMIYHASVMLVRGIVTHICCDKNKIKRKIVLTL